MRKKSPGGSACLFELNVSAYISDEYRGHVTENGDIPSNSCGKQLEEAADLEEEVEDRFGDIPEATRNL